MKKRILCVLLSLVMLLTAIFLRISRFYTESCRIYSEEGIKGTISNKINLEMISFVSNNRLYYKDIAKIEHTSNGNIGSVIIDTNKINLMANELTKSIYNCIDTAKNCFGIPLGNTLGIEILSGKGVDIPFTVVPVGSVVYKIESELQSGGINQTLHRITIRFDIVVKCIAPFYNTSCSINTEIVVAETVIVGNIPNVILSES